MECRRMAWVVAVLGVLGIGGCATTKVDFDKLPNGAAVPGQSVPVLQGGTVSPQSLISNQYAPEGLTFSSGSPAVFAGSFSSDAPSAPNAACPTQANGTAGYSDKTVIGVSESHICNVWVTITKTSGPTTMTAFDVSGNQVGPAVSSHGSAPGQPGVNETLHINACGIHRVELTGGNYCFDDVKIRR